MRALMPLIAPLVPTLRSACSSALGFATTDSRSIWDSYEEIPEYLGINPREAQERAAANGVTWVRIVDFDDELRRNMTFDYIQSRLTLLIDKGQVVRSRFF